MRHPLLHRLHRRLAIALIAMALAASACGSTGPAPSNPLSAESTNPPAAGHGTEVATSDGDEPVRSLDEYLGTMGALMRGSGNFSEEQFEAERQLIEREVQLCMQEAGFEYTPGEAGGTFFLASNADESGTETEQAQRNGFGISTSFETLTDIDMSFEPPAANSLAGADGAEIDARNRALWGEDALRFEIPEGEDPSSFAMSDAPEGFGFGAGGCVADAEAKIRGDVDALNAISSQLDELDSRIAADPRVALIGREWASCMRTAGFNYETRDEALEAIQVRFEPFLRTFFSTIVIADADGDGDVPTSPSGFGGAELTDVQEKELAELQDHERAVATASLECEGDSSDVLDAISAEYEAVFVEENRSLLESIGR